MFPGIKSLPQNTIKLTEYTPPLNKIQLEESRPLNTRKTERIVPYLNTIQFKACHRITQNWQKTHLI
jgi:hypothetical protein